MEPKETLDSWLAANRVLVWLVGLGFAFIAATLLLSRRMRPDITDLASRTNCEQLYRNAKTHAESLAVDTRVAAAMTTERKIGYLQPDVRCGEVRVYDSRDTVPTAKEPPTPKATPTNPERRPDPGRSG